MRAAVGGGAPARGRRAGVRRRARARRAGREEREPRIAVDAPRDGERARDPRGWTPAASGGGRRDGAVANATSAPGSAPNAPNERRRGGRGRRGEGVRRPTSPPPSSTRRSFQLPRATMRWNLLPAGSPAADECCSARTLSNADDQNGRPRRGKYRSSPFASSRAASRPRPALRPDSPPKTTRAPPPAFPFAACPFLVAAVAPLLFPRTRGSRPRGDSSPSSMHPADPPPRPLLRRVAPTGRPARAGDGGGEPHAEEEADPYEKKSSVLVVRLSVGDPDARCRLPTTKTKTRLRARRRAAAHPGRRRLVRSNAPRVRPAAGLRAARAPAPDPDRAAGSAASSVVGRSSPRGSTRALGGFVHHGRGRVRFAGRTLSSLNPAARSSRRAPAALGVPDVVLVEFAHREPLRPAHRVDLDRVLVEHLDRGLRLPRRHLVRAGIAAAPPGRPARLGTGTRRGRGGARAVVRREAALFPALSLDARSRRRSRRAWRRPRGQSRRTTTTRSARGGRPRPATRPSGSRASAPPPPSSPPRPGSRRLNPWPNTALGSEITGGDRRRSRRSRSRRSRSRSASRLRPSDDEAFPSPPPSCPRRESRRRRSRRRRSSRRGRGDAEGDAIAGSDAFGRAPRVGRAEEERRRGRGRAGGGVEGGGVDASDADPSIASAKAPTGSLVKSEKSRGELTYPANPRTGLDVWPMSRVLLMMRPRTGRWYSRFPKGCSICSAAASVPNSASASSAVVGTTARRPTVDEDERQRAHVHHERALEVRDDAPGRGLVHHLALADASTTSNRSSLSIPPRTGRRSCFQAA